MELSEIVEFARNFATMVRVKGADPKGLKVRNHAFHNYNSGSTTLSASGMLLPDNLRNACMLTNGINSSNSAPCCAVVVSVASIIEPFLAIKTKDANMQALPELVPHTQIDVMIEQKGPMKRSVEGMDNHAVQWFPAKILRLVDVPASSLAVQLLMESSSPSLEHNWDVGWSLGSNKNHPKGAVNGIHSQEFISSNNSETQQSRQPDLMAKSITRVVFLQVPDLCMKDMPEISISPSSHRGDLLVALGSPFGILSPVHFFNSVSTGIIANCYPPTTYDQSLLMADIHCLPGMEGAPIIGQQSNLVGLLARPLSQNGGAEIQLVIPWKAIEAACRVSCQLVRQNKRNEVQSIKEIQSSDMIMPSTSIKKQLTSCSGSSLLEQAMASVCLVTVGNGVWASGIVLNSDGLILTNAHLIEPWRFGGATLSSGCDENKTKDSLVFFKDSNSENNTSLDHLYKGSDSHTAFRGVRQISVRLDHAEPWVWCTAKVVYVCQGTLDIALLMLESVPTQLCPINVDLSYPTQGSKAFVIGHGLFGPRCRLYPSVSSGVVAQVVKSGLVENVRGELPTMIQTTAAVHPGSSGGAVVNSTGTMIGLVTSNAKHGGQTIIPHLNFSIPCAAMEPIFKFAADMKNSSVLHELDKPNKKLSSVWSLVPPLPAESGPSTIAGVQDLLKKGKQGKGSRFAKFIAEKEDLFKKLNQVKAGGSLPGDTIPSKL